MLNEIEKVKKQFRGFQYTVADDTAINGYNPNGYNPRTIFFEFINLNKISRLIMVYKDGSTSCWRGKDLCNIAYFNRLSMKVFTKSKFDMLWTLYKDKD
jgi:hypothetical protein